jgi:serine/threonine-protein kinase HipA
MTKQLFVYLQDRLIGTLLDKGNARLAFAYDEQYLLDSPVALSISLPLTDQPFEDNEARPFFSGLLPDDQELDRLAQHLKVSKQNVFKLLALVGGECAGAVSLFETPMQEEKRQTNKKLPHDKPLGDAELEKILRHAKTRPMLGGDDKVRLSLAGAQSKLAVVIRQGKVYYSAPENPSTHILKPPSQHVEGLVQNEYFCMQLANAVGILVPETNLRDVGETQVYQIQRYDRHTVDGLPHRQHQEDFCQALGVVPENKYQTEGGPSLEECVALIQTHSTKPAFDYQQFLDRVVFNYLIGNNDAHAKNFSFLYKNGNAMLSPAYDLVSTVVYPQLNPKMAMKIGGRYSADDLQRRHWERLVPDIKTSKKTLQASVLALCARVEHALAKGEADYFNIEQNQAIISQIVALIEKRVERLKDVFG